MTALRCWYNQAFHRSGSVISSTEVPGSWPDSAIVTRSSYFFLVNCCQYCSRINHPPNPAAISMAVSVIHPIEKIHEIISRIAVTQSVPLTGAVSNLEEGSSTPFADVEFNSDVRLTKVAPVSRNRSTGE